jgi:hypothetical protein
MPLTSAYCTALCSSRYLRADVKTVRSSAIVIVIA